MRNLLTALNYLPMLLIAPDQGQIKFDTIMNIETNQIQTCLHYTDLSHLLSVRRNCRDDLWSIIAQKEQSFIEHRSLLVKQIIKSLELHGADGPCSMRDAGLLQMKSGIISFSERFSSILEAKSVYKLIKFMGTTEMRHEIELGVIKMGKVFVTLTQDRSGFASIVYPDARTSQGFMLDGDFLTEPEQEFSVENNTFNLALAYLIPYLVEEMMLDSQPYLQIYYTYCTLQFIRNLWQGKVSYSRSLEEKQNFCLRDDELAYTLQVFADRA